MQFPSEKVEDSSFYLELALRKSREKLRRVELRRGTGLERKQALERQRLSYFREALTKELVRIIQSFPSLDGLNEFYTELTRATLETDSLKKGLVELHWAHKKIAELIENYRIKIKNSSNTQELQKSKQACLGRVSSILRQLDKPLRLMEKSRRIMRHYPLLKEGYTVAIAGFPNVGKSTLLSKLTTAKPEIKAYAFTTKNLNIGYMHKHPVRVQIIDTPGTLARFEKMNNIEKQAYLAMKYAAHVIIYVFDLTETSYPLIDQERLYESVLSLDKPVILYLSKTDLLEKEKTCDFLKKYSQTFIDVGKLKQKLAEQARAY